MIARLVLAFLFCAAVDAGAAHAYPALLGHFSPGAGDVYLTIDGREVAMLRYRDTARVEIPRPDFRIEVRRVTNGERLHAQDVAGFAPLDPGNPAIPTILFAGDARSQPRQLMLDPGPRRRTSPVPNLPVQPYTQLRRLLAVASYPGAERYENAVSIVRDCTRPSTSPGREDRTIGGDRASFADTTMSGWAGSDGVEQYTCRLDIVVPGHATMTMTYPSELGVSRLFVIGNGIDEPFEALLMVGDRVAHSVGQATRQPGALLRSEHFWFDATRPGQGIALFEIPGARAVLGTWYTYEADGSPVWYVLDGGHADMPGRRDVAIQRTRTTASGVEMRQVGTGRIVYADCNEAEFRAVVGDSVRVMSARRAKPVQRCTELD